MRAVFAAGAALGVIVFLVFVGVLAGADEQPTVPSRPSAVTPMPTASATPSPTASTSTSTPTARPLSQRALLEAMYEPIAWDDPARVSRTPPPTEAAAEAEAAVHRGAYERPEVLPAVFAEAGVSSEGCVSLDGTTETLARSGDWVLSAPGYVGVFTNIEAYDAFRQSKVELIPADPALLLGGELRPVRIRMLDTGNWRATHLEEHGVRPTARAAGGFAYDLRIESPRNASWLAVVTAGPLWGCFEFTGSLPRSEVSWQRSIDDIGVRTVPTHEGADLSCPELPRVGSAIVGDFETVGLGEQFEQRWDPGARDAGPLSLLDAETDPDSANLQLRAVLLIDGQVEPVHTYRLVAAARAVPVSSTLAPDYAIAPVLPRAGEWLVTASAGPENWGCFTVTVG